MVGCYCKLSDTLKSFFFSDRSEYPFLVTYVINGPGCVFGDSAFESLNSTSVLANHEFFFLVVVVVAVPFARSKAFTAGSLSDTWMLSTPLLLCRLFSTLTTEFCR